MRPEKNARVISILNDGEEFRGMCKAGSQTSERRIDRGGQSVRDS